MAVDMFLDLKGIPGESQDSKFKDKIDVLAWSWGMSQNGTTHMGPGGGSGKAAFQDISVTHWFDKASNNLMLYLAKGTHIPEGKLVVRKAGDKPLDYIVMDFTDLIVTSVSTGGSGGEERLTENFTLNFAQVKVKYQQQNKDGSGTPGPEFSWNIPQNIPA